MPTLTLNVKSVHEIIQSEDEVIVVELPQKTQTNGTLMDEETTPGIKDVLDASNKQNKQFITASDSKKDPKLA